MTARAFRFLLALLRRRRAHTPRLWPIALVDFDTHEVHYELGAFDTTLQRVRAR